MARRFRSALTLSVLLLLAWLGLQTAIAPKNTVAPKSALLAAVLAACAFAVLHRLESRPERPRTGSRGATIAAFGGLAALVLVVQLHVAHALWTPQSGWDSEVVTQAAILLGADGDISPALDYFATYQINIPLLVVLSDALHVAHAVGVHDHDVLVLLGLNCFLIFAAVLVTTALAGRLFGRRAAVVAGVLVTILVGWSGWTATSYTDTYGVLFPVLTVWCWLHALRARARTALLWAAASGASVAFGAAMKPTVPIVVLAGLLVWLVARRDLRLRLPHRRYAALAVVGAVCAVGVTAGLRIHASRVLDVPEERAAPIEMWVLFGLSYTPPPEDDDSVDDGVAFWGTWNRHDVDLVLAEDTKHGRREVARDAIADRLRDLGPSGYVRFLSEKEAFTFADGTFGLFMEGRQMDVPYPEAVWTDAALRGFYRGEDVPVSEGTLAQAAWLLVLALVVRQLSRRWRPDVSAWYFYLVVVVAGVLLYTMLFEARSRYLFVFAPMVVLLAVASISSRDGATVAPSTSDRGRHDA